MTWPLFVPNELVPADMLVYCSKEGHDECNALQKTLLEKHPEIKESHIIDNPRKDGYCISALAKIDPYTVNAFLRRLRKLKTDDNTLHVKTISISLC